MKARQAKRLARSVSTLSLLVVIGAGFSTISAASDETTNTGSVKSNYVQVVVTPGEIFMVNCPISCRWWQCLRGGGPDCGDQPVEHS
jgi:hypothetical protein